MNEKNNLKIMNEKLEVRLKKSYVKIQILRKKIEYYKRAHSKLKNIFLSGLEVFKQVDFSNSDSIKVNKLSLEVLQRTFLEQDNKIRSLRAIPTERELERYVLQKDSSYAEDHETKRCKSNFISSSDSEDLDPDVTNDLELALSWNLEHIVSGSDDEQLRDSGLESVKEEVGANEVDLSDINFGDLSTAGETNGNNRSDDGNQSNNWTGSGTEVAGSGCDNAEARSGSLVKVKPEVVMFDANPEESSNANTPVENPEGNRNPQNSASILEANRQMNEAVKGLVYNSTTLAITPLPETPLPVIYPPSRELFESSDSHKSTNFLQNSHRQYQMGVTRRQSNNLMTDTSDDVSSTMIDRLNKSPVFKGFNSRRQSARHVGDCSTPFRQLNENFERTFLTLQGCSRSSPRKKMFSGGKSTNVIYRKPGQGEDGPSGVKRLRRTFLNVERFRRRNSERGTTPEDRENESFAREQESDYRRYDNTSEDEEDEGDDIIYGSPRKDKQMYFNPKNQNSRREAPQEQCCQTIPQSSAAYDLDETFISPTVVRNYQMSRGLGPPMQYNFQARETSPEYDSVPYAYHRGPVRKRAERMKLPGKDCDECQKYYKNVYGDANVSDYNRILNKCSRHRNAGYQDDTPPGFWTPFLTGNEEV